MGILTNDMKRIVDEQQRGFVATVCPDGTPNLSPKGTAIAWDDDHIVFADIRSPMTVANLRANPHVEINVVDPFVRKGYRLKAVARVLTDGPEFATIVAFYRQRGTRSPIRAIVLVRVERALPLRSPVYDQNSHEPEVRARWVPHFAALEATQHAEKHI